MSRGGSQCRQRSAAIRMVSSGDQGFFRAFGAGVSPQRRADVRGHSCGGEDALAQEVVAGTAEHLSLDGLQSVDLPLDRARASRLGDRGMNSGLVPGETLREDAEFALPRRGEPVVQARAVTGTDHGSEAPCQRGSVRKLRSRLAQAHDEGPLVRRQLVRLKAEQPSAAPPRRHAPRRRMCRSSNGRAGSVRSAVRCGPPPDGIEAAGESLSFWTRRTVRLDHIDHRPAEPLPPAGQGLQAPEPKCACFPALGLYPAHAPKDLPSNIVIPNEHYVPRPSNDISEVRNQYVPNSVTR